MTGSAESFSSAGEGQIVSQSFAVEPWASDWNLGKMLDSDSQILVLRENQIAVVPQNFAGDRNHPDRRNFALSPHHYTDEILADCHIADCQSPAGFQMADCHI